MSGFGGIADIGKPLLDLRFWRHSGHHEAGKTLKVRPTLYPRLLGADLGTFHNLSLCELANDTRGRANASQLHSD